MLDIIRPQNRIVSTDNMTLRIRIYLDCISTVSYLEGFPYKNIINPHPILLLNAHIYCFCIVFATASLHFNITLEHLMFSVATCNKIQDTLHANTGKMAGKFKRRNSLNVLV